MEHGHTQILLGLLISFVAALVGGEIAQRLKMPAVVGQIAAGVVVGPSAMGWLTISEPLTLLSELGAILLLFAVGLETKLGDLRKVGKTALLVGLLGVALPFVLGAGWAMLSGFPTPKAMFVAAAFVATSAGITAKVLQELGALGRKEARIIMGAAVIDDVLAMLLLAVVSSLQSEAGVDFMNLLKILGGAIGFVAVVALLGTYVMKRSSKLLDAPIDNESPLPVSFAIGLALAVASAFVGLAAIIGAFLAGMVLAETPHRKDLEHDFARVSAILVPFFFVVTGANVDVKLLANGPVLLSVFVVTILAVVGKLVGCGLGARSLGKRGALTVGMGMVPRGEVGVIVAGLGQQAGVFPPKTYAIIVGMSLLTSVIAPPFLKRLLADPGEPAPQSGESTTA
ncbi:cation:proton antiporter [bacterium]|nr:MAG: cation:proton antiporter [bacterium]